MGCDIHVYAEKKVEGVWVTADEWVTDEDGWVHVPYDKRIYSERNYNLFGVLCDGIRGRSYSFSVERKGIPKDACDEYLEEVRRWGGDDHSHSWLSLTELKSLQEKILSESIPISGMINVDRLEKLLKSIAEGQPNYDLLYPYCTYTTRGDWLSFQLNLPATEDIGDGISGMIDKLESMDAEDARICFFFDN